MPVSAPSSCACDVHFVGSIPLSNGAEVMQTLSARFGPWLPRIPDGETGERTNWIQYQEDVIARLPGARKVEGTGDPRGATAKRAQTGRFAVPADIQLEPSMLGDLGYAHAALESYTDYSILKANAAIAPECCYMVALPSPYSVISFCVLKESAAAIEAVYEARLLQELEQITTKIPSNELSIQWDIVHDMQAFDEASLRAASAAGNTAAVERRTPWFSPSKAGIVDRCVRLGNAVPKGVELGYHLCYGSYGGRHFIEPESMAAMVDLSNAIIDGVNRPVDFIHMPVPIEREDDAYYAPLAGLKRPEGMKLYLGLIHWRDGADATMRRVAAARRFTRDFGVSTECGFGRMTAAEVPAILAVHEQVLKQMESAA